MDVTDQREGNSYKYDIDVVLPLREMILNYYKLSPYFMCTSFMSG